MTSKIYIRGDIGGPSVDLEVYDADTHTRLDDILYADITVGVNAQTEATLHANNGAKRVVDVVEDPGRSRKSSVLPTSRCEFDLKISEWRDGVSSETMVTAELGRQGAVRTKCSRIVSDQEQVKAIYDAMQMGREDVLRQVLEPVIQELAKKQPPTTTSRMANGGVVSKPSRPIFPPAMDYDALDPFKRGEVKTHRPPCQECKGTGEVELFSGSVPCSTCAPDLGDPMTKVAQTLADIGRPRKGDKVFNGDEYVGTVTRVHDWSVDPMHYMRSLDGSYNCKDAEKSILEVLKRNAEKMRRTMNPCAEIDLGDGQGIQRLPRDEAREKFEEASQKRAAGRRTGAEIDPSLTEITLEFLQQGRPFTADDAFPKLNMEPQRNQNIKDGEECPDCKGTGKVTLFTSEEDCSTCCS